MVKLSVIIPCYNGGTYLSNCVDSVIKNKIDDMEIILVNDGSKDNSIDIMNEYKKRYPDLIKVIDQHNMGLSMARNNGVNNANGEYISFIDCDDSIKDGLYSKFLEKIKQYNYDMLVFGEDRIFDEHNVLVDSGIGNDCYNKDDVKKIMFSIYPAACNKIIKKDFFQYVTFKRGVWYEDVEFIYRLLPLVNSIGVIDGYYYNYYQRENSMTYTYSDRLYDLIDNLNGLITYYKDNDIFDDYHDEIEYVYVRYSYATFIKRLSKMKNKKEFNKGVNEVLNNVKNLFPHYKKNKYMNGKKGLYLKHFNKLISKIVYLQEKDRLN